MSIYNQNIAGFAVFGSTFGNNTVLSCNSTENKDIYVMS